MWDWFIQFIASVLQAIAGFTGDWGLAIIVLTLIIRVLIMPLMTKSTASSAKMQALQPMMQDIQNRYADDPERQAQELQKFYAENKFNPLGGCLPMLIQMPVFFALFTVARNYVPEGQGFYNIVPSLSESASTMLASGGISAAAIYLILDVMFGVLTLVPMLLNARNTADSSQRMQSITMGVVMSVMMVWVGFRMPAAVLLYYDTSAIWQVVQQQLVTQRVMEKVKAETAADLEARGIQQDIQVVRRERKQRPHKKK